MSENVELHEWRDLTGSPGWQRLRAYARERWLESGYKAQMLRILDAEGAGAEEALSKLRQMATAAREIERLLNFPESRIATLTRLDSSTQPDYPVHLGHLR